MVSLSTIGRLIYIQILKFQMTQNETHHFNNAIWVIADLSEEEFKEYHHQKISDSSDFFSISGTSDFIFS
jgi:hypothetical protein